MSILYEHTTSFDVRLHLSRDWRNGVPKAAKNGLRAAALSVHSVCSRNRPLHFIYNLSSNYEYYHISLSTFVYDDVVIVVALDTLWIASARCYQFYGASFFFYRYQN